MRPWSGSACGTRCWQSPRRGPGLTVPTAGYHYGQVVALAAKGTGLEKIAAAVTADDNAGLNAAGYVLALAVLAAKARIADAQQHSTDAIALLTDASAKEDSLPYDEP